MGVELGTARKAPGSSARDLRTSLTLFHELLKKLPGCLFCVTIKLTLDKKRKKIRDITYRILLVSLVHGFT